MDNKNISDWKLIWRSLMPSVSSVAGGFFVGVAIIGFHMLLLSRRTDLFVPHLTGASNDQVAEIYSSSVLKPVDQVFGNQTFGMIVTALLWGLVGWVIYAVLDYTLTSMKEWRRSKTDISMPSKSQVVRHPMQKQFIIRNLWRFLLSIALVAFTVGIQPVIGDLLQNDLLALKTVQATEMLKYLGVALLGWIIIIHVYVVLLRLFVFRTRIFGEILY